jgi:hypothetical protein
VFLYYFPALFSFSSRLCRPGSDPLYTLPGEGTEEEEDELGDLFPASAGAGEAGVFRSLDEARAWAQMLSVDELRVRRTKERILASIIDM